eukprot:GHVL01026212.1.p1 GENE.GHVL01026212.1~~GHVL01026212.1.p1  ORF type:complete len:302 (+),score=73.25 GHVL01026212.1:412-1317(+)
MTLLCLKIILKNKNYANDEFIQVLLNNLYDQRNEIFSNKANLKKNISNIFEILRNFEDPPKEFIDVFINELSNIVPELDANICASIMRNFSVMNFDIDMNIMKKLVERVIKEKDNMESISGALQALTDLPDMTTETQQLIDVLTTENIKNCTPIQTRNIFRALIKGEIKNQRKEIIEQLLENMASNNITSHTNLQEEFLRCVPSLLKSKFSSKSVIKVLPYISPNSVKYAVNLYSRIKLDDEEIWEGLSEQILARSGPDADIKLRIEPQDLLKNVPKYIAKAPPFPLKSKLLELFERLSQN